VDHSPRGFARIARAPFDGSDRVRLRLIVDDSSIEAFADEGATVITARVFPTDPSVRRVRTTSDGRGARVTIHDHQLRRIVNR
jgi:fructan beta-fructosidase